MSSARSRADATCAGSWGRSSASEGTRLTTRVAAAGSEPTSPAASSVASRQADAASTFDKLFENGKVLEVACGAHMRRYFYNARDEDPLAASTALAYFRRLYMLERELKELPDAERQCQRQERAVPILEQFKRWLDAQRATPKSQFGAALH